MRELNELIELREPGMALVREWLAGARNPVELIAGDRARGDAALLALQVSTRSPMGAIAHETGGLLVDDGWLRILGGGSVRLDRSLPDWNRLPDGRHRMPGALLIGDDAVGGFFALNGGALGDEVGQVFYFAPDRLEWEETDYSYSEWLCWGFTGDLDKYYESMRWPDWREQVRELPAGQAFFTMPPMWAAAPDGRTRGAVPVDELWRLQQDFAAQLASQTAPPAVPQPL